LLKINIKIYKIYIKIFLSPPSPTQGVEELQFVMVGKYIKSSNKAPKGLGSTRVVKMKCEKILVP
jgi:hypothetical protein